MQKLQLHFIAEKTGNRRGHQVCWTDRQPQWSTAKSHILAGNQGFPDSNVHIREV